MAKAGDAAFDGGGVVKKANKVLKLKKKCKQNINFYCSILFIVCASVDSDFFIKADSLCSPFIHPLSPKGFKAPIAIQCLIKSEKRSGL